VAGDARRLTLPRWRPGGRARLGGRVRTLATVLRAHEQVGGRRTDWLWAFAEDGALLEVAPRGRRVYTSHRVLAPGSEPFLQIAAPDGALTRFERRVRAGRHDAEPTFVALGGREFRLLATGNAAVERDGPPPALGGWSSLGGDPAENVYFLMTDVADGAPVLGLWTRVLCLSFGAPPTSPLPRPPSS
jgi:hypothetical protein